MRPVTSIPPGIRIFTAFFCVFAATLCAAHAAAAETAGLFVVARGTRVYQLDEGRLVAQREVPSGTLVSAMETRIPEGATQPYREVRSVSPTVVFAGWIAQADVQPVGGAAKEAAAQDAAANPAASASRAGENLQPPPADSGESDADLPELIRLQRNPKLRQAWRQVAQAIRENDSLPKRLPEPYFARAEIWTAVNNYDAAIRDYLAATMAARESNQDLAVYSAYFRRLHDALDNLDRVPKAPTLGVAKDRECAGRVHYAEGFHAFWSQDYHNALARFDNAVQASPTEPLYWYYRALSFLQLGDPRRAQHDVLVGVHLERNSLPTERSYIFQALERVQGKPRRWLQGYRLGDTSHRNLAGVKVIDPQPAD